MSEKNYLTKILTDTVMTRRSFLKWSAALGGTAALAGGISYGLKAVEAAAQTTESDGEWVLAACWHNCGGRCPNWALVKDGVVIRQKSDDTHPDSPDYPQQRACVRGRSQRMQVLGPDRLKYPMKRKNWEPGGGNKELRGKDEWVRISWEEALNLTGTEIKRIKDTYGNKAIMNLTSSQLIAAYGGSYIPWGLVSVGAWPFPVLHMTGRFQGNVFFADHLFNDRLDLRNSKLIVMWGANPAWSSAGLPAYNYLQAKKAGAKIISVDPFYNPSATVLADEWIPVRPSTDAALLLALAYYMITNNLQDQEFLDKYVVGFDADHMPEGADPKENFKDYVLGTYDGIPKTPEWASQICGTDPDTIRHFATEIASVKPMAFLSSFAPARTYLGEQYCQAFLTVGWMTGNVGMSGAMVSDCGHQMQSNGGPGLIFAGGNGVTPVTDPISPVGFFQALAASPKDVSFGIVWDEAWTAITDGEFTDGPRGKVKTDIHMIYSVGASAGLNSYPGINKGIDAFRKVDFVVSSAHFLATVPKYSDIVFPATTEWERYGTMLSGNREILIYASQVIQPLYEAKDDIEIEVELAKRLGVDPNIIYPIPLKQQIFNQVAGAMVVKPDGSGYETLVTITDQDIAELGVQGKPQTGRVPYKEFKQKGIYQVERKPGDNLGYIALKDFRTDPVANPLKTPSGKLQIHSQALADQVAAYGWNTLAPIPKYVPPDEGYEATFNNMDTGEKGEYPLQFFTPHYLRRSHTTLDNVQWLREAWPEELFINPVDADSRGIKSGDTVKVTSKHGEVLRHAKITNRLTQGVVALGEGAWVDKDDATGIDQGGATNSINGARPNGTGEQAWNTTVVQIEKYTPPIPADVNQPQRIVFKEG